MAKLVLLIVAGCFALSNDSANQALAADFSVVHPIKRHRYSVHSGYRRVYVRRIGDCQIVGACSLFGAYGPDGGPRFWGAYTGGGGFFR